MGNLHRQTIESLAALAGLATVIGKTHDMESVRAAALAVGVVITRDTDDTNVDVIVEHSYDASAWRTVELTNLAVSVGTPTQEFDKDYATTRRYLRARLENKVDKALSVTEFITVRKERP